MPKYVVVGGFLECNHGGKVQLTSGSAKVRIDGSEVVVAGQEAKYSFAASQPPCPHTSPVPAPSPCTVTGPATDGVSTKFTVDGFGVLLDTATGLCTNPNDPAAKWTVADAGQTLVGEA